MAAISRIGNHTQRNRKGAAVVELAACLPLLLVLVLGLLEVGRIASVRQLLANAAREAARQAASGLSTNSQVSSVVTEYLSRAGLSTSHVAVSVANETTSGVDAKSATQLDRLKVNVSIPYADARLLDATLVTSGDTMLRAEAVWLSLRDKPYPSPPEPDIE